MSQIVKFGIDVLDNLEFYLNRKKLQSIFLVTGKNLIRYVEQKVS